VTAIAIALTVAAGFAGAVQAAVMGELGDRAGVFPALAFSGIVAAAVGVAGLLVAKQSFGGLGGVARQPVWLWTGGALGTVVVLAITVATPRIGVTATIGILIALNLAVAGVIDHFGFFGFDRAPLTSLRVAGIVLLAVGAALALGKRG
jgi:bacterial/archaeal transporter family-2 protein